MLAEPRNRVKYSVNPRGLDWSNDDSKLGQKLLEKMGWKKGNALGLRENGNPEPIKVLTKSDRRGVGCTVKHADNWIAHQDDFSSILAGLNEGSSCQPVDEESSSSFSLEQKSKNSRSRVHYQKFAKGKDLSRYETADLQSIFGQRQKQETVASSDSPEQSQTADGDEGKMSFGVITVTSSTSIDSYFAQKMAEVKQRLALGSEHATKKASDDTANNVIDETEITCADNETKHKKKKRRRDVKFSIELEDELPPEKNKKKSKAESSNTLVNLHNADEDCHEKQKKHKKSKKRKMDVEVSNDSVAEADSCSDVFNTVSASDQLRDTQVDCVSDGKSRARKKSKKRSRDDEGHRQCESESAADCTDGMSQVDAEKSKRKPMNIDQEQEDCQSKTKRKKKKKSKKIDQC